MMANGRSARHIMKRRISIPGATDETGDRFRLWFAPPPRTMAGMLAAVLRKDHEILEFFVKTWEKWPVSDATPCRLGRRSKIVSRLPKVPRESRNLGALCENVGKMPCFPDGMRQARIMT